jgi:3-deoxy-D-manno-octulosonic-acid transferase
MYLAYSFLSLLVLVLCRRTSFTRQCATRSTSAASASGSATCRSRCNVDGDASIWIHAVSVGEALTASALIADLRAAVPAAPAVPVDDDHCGQQVARKNLQQVDAVFYFPFDWAFTVRRTLNIVKPRMFIMMETEIWPNLLRECRARGIKTVVINGRISSRSYPRYRLVRPLFRRVLADIDRFCMQGEESARRIIDLGADPKRVTVTGSLKFDSLQVPAPGVARAAA